MPNVNVARKLPPLSLDQVDDPSRLIRAGLTLIGALVVGIGLWVAFAPLSGAVMAPGFIKADMNRKTVQHQEGGIVGEILVRDGSHVKSGQTLLVLRDVRVDSSQDLLATQLDSAMAKAARLRAEQLLAQTVAFPRELTERSSEQRVAELIARETALFEARTNALNEQTALIRNQVRETTREIEARSQQLTAGQKVVRLQTEELNSNTALLDKGFVSKTRLLALQRALSEYEARLSDNRAELAQARQRVVDQELRIASLRNNFAEQAARELKETTAQVYDLEQRLRPMVDASVRQKLTAPISGEVVDLRVTTVGAVIGPRDPILDILPENPDLIIEARIRTEDINYVRTGADADVRLTAFKQRITPVVEGKVVYVSADRLLEKNAAPPSQPYYAVHVRVSPEALKKAGDLKLQAGMPAEVFIHATERTALEYLLNPITSFLQRSMREP
jgi:HlyD family type I secretion membrane fusion protein